MRRTLIAAILALAAALAVASPAAATVREVTLRYGPIHMAPYELKRGDITYGIPTPRMDGFVTHMEANVVDASDRLPVGVDCRSAEQQTDAEVRARHHLLLECGR